MAAPARQTSIPSNITDLLCRIAELVSADDAFDSVELRQTMVHCHAAGAPAEAFYRVEFADGRLWVTWVSPDRYLSQSIEQVLVFTGDDLDDMIDEELVDLGWTRGALGRNEHFRDDEKLFTFRSALPVDAATIVGAELARDAVRVLHAYRIALGQMGDMEAGEDDGE